jgi:uncharacterized protein (DUF1800 family)
MKSRVFVLLGLAGLLHVSTQPFQIAAADAPVITDYRSSNTLRAFKFSLYPGAQSYTIQTTTNLSDAFANDPNFLLASFAVTNFATNSVTTTNGTVYLITTNIQTFWEWRRTGITSPSFHRVVATPMTANSLLAAHVLNRLTYGPTPDEVQRINAIGPDAYIAEQLASWNITEDVNGTHASIPSIGARFVSATNVVVGTRPQYYTNIFYTTNDTIITTNYVTLTNAIYGTNAVLSDLRAWHVLRAVGAKRQLLEVLLQFLENHFVTQQSKSLNYFAGKYDNGTLENALATQAEYLELERWRQALLNPACTFHNLSRISAESPAMIIYLDTVSSRGDSGRVANENYARELMELFNNGVDNGYDGTDITVMSRCWTGWTLELVDPSKANNPFALKTTTPAPIINTNIGPDDYRNLEGVWARIYRANWHNTSTKTIFTNKFIPARYGAPWTTKTYGTNTVTGKYQLVVPGRTGTNGIQEGYEVVQYLADLPFTQEYISIKLCRLFVHDEFPNPNNDPTSPEYDFYNYAGGNLSPEADLVKQCMLTWETNAPKGQIWKVLDTIFKSDLFRSEAAMSQKVKTPLEFMVSAIRALRSSTNGSNLAGSFTAWTDGYALPTPLQRMGLMLLFDRDAPDGYPESADYWINASTLAERVRWAQSFCIGSGASGHTGSQGGTGNDAQNSLCNPVGLIKAKLPSFSWNNAGAVADYFLGILYPGQGAGNLQFARQTAINFLNDGKADSQTTYQNTAFAGVPNAHPSYDERVRGMVGALLALPRYQEQ